MEHIQIVALNIVQWNIWLCRPFADVCTLSGVLECTTCHNSTCYETDGLNHWLLGATSEYLNVVSQMRHKFFRQHTARQHAQQKDLSPYTVFTWMNRPPPPGQMDNLSKQTAWSLPALVHIEYAKPSESACVPSLPPFQLYIHFTFIFIRCPRESVVAGFHCRG